MESYPPLVWVFKDYKKDFIAFQLVYFALFILISWASISLCWPVLFFLPCFWTPLFIICFCSMFLPVHLGGEKSVIWMVTKPQFKFLTIHSNHSWFWFISLLKKKQLNTIVSFLGVCFFYPFPPPQKKNKVGKALKPFPMFSFIFLPMYLGAIDLIAMLTKAYFAP